MRRIIEKLKLKTNKIKEDRKEDAWFWFIIGFTVYGVLCIISDLTGSNIISLILTNILGIYYCYSKWKSEKGSK